VISRASPTLRELVSPNAFGDHVADGISAGWGMVWSAFQATPFHSGYTKIQKWKGFRELSQSRVLAIFGAELSQSE